MGKIVSYTVEEMKKIPPIDINTISDTIIDPDIEFDASNDISNEAMNHIISKKKSFVTELFKSISIP